MRYVVELVGPDPYTDIAVLKIQTEEELYLYFEIPTLTDWGMGFGYWESL